MKRRRIVQWLAAIAIVISVLIAALSPRALTLAGRWLDVGGPPQKADAVVLLNGGYNTRPFVAAALVHGGWAPKVIFTTVAPHPMQIAKVVPPSSEIVQQILKYGGVPRTQVELLETSAQTTFDEAKSLADYLLEHPMRRLMIVTEGPHTRRAEWIFRRTLAGQPVELVMISAPTDEFDAATWWCCEQGFLFVVSEYFKLLFYALRYSWLGYELAVTVALIIFLCAWFRRRRKPVPSRSV